MFLPYFDKVKKRIKTYAFIFQNFEMDMVFRALAFKDNTFKTVLSRRKNIKFELSGIRKGRIN